MMVEFARAVVWCLVASVSMGVSMGLVIKIYDMLTPGLDELDELRKGNVAVGIVLGCLILATGYVIGAVFHTPPEPESCPRALRWRGFGYLRAATMSR